jgi:hypothetical protein
MKRKFKRQVFPLDTESLLRDEKCVLDEVRSWGITVSELRSEVFLPREYIEFILGRLRRKGLIKTHRETIASWGEP